MSKKDLCWCERSWEFPHTTLWRPCDVTAACQCHWHCLVVQTSTSPCQWVAETPGSCLVVRGWWRTMPTPPTLASTHTHTSLTAILQGKLAPLTISHFKWQFGLVVIAVCQPRSVNLLYVMPGLVLGWVTVFGQETISASWDTSASASHHV